MTLGHDIAQSLMAPRPRDETEFDQSEGDPDEETEKPAPKGDHHQKGHDADRNITDHRDPESRRRSALIDHTDSHQLLSDTLPCKPFERQSIGHDRIEKTEQRSDAAPEQESEKDHDQEVGEFCKNPGLQTCVIQTLIPSERTGPSHRPGSEQ